MSLGEGRAHVCLSFDLDAISLWLGTFKTRSLSMISRGEFAEVGVMRILALLEDYGAQATWFIPGHTLDTYPRLVEEVQAKGHAIGHHGYCHENPTELAPADERRVLEKGIGSIERVTGERPVGYRSPSWDISEHTVSLLLEYGFVFDSSMMGRDFEPYWVRQGDSFDLEGPYRFGDPVPLVELPVSWVLDDFPFFEYVSLPQKLYPGLRDPDDVFRIWSAEFDYMCRSVPEGVFTLTMHPQVIGRGHRMAMLERLLQHIQASGRATFSRMDDVALRWRSDNEPRTPG